MNKTVVIKEEDVRLLRDVVSARFRNQSSGGNAIVCALEGFHWLLGEESAVDQEFLRNEWEHHTGEEVGKQ